MVALGVLPAPADRVSTGGFGDPRPLLGLSPDAAALIGAARTPDGAALVAYESGGAVYAVEAGTGGRPQRIGAAPWFPIFQSTLIPGAVLAAADGARAIAWFDPDDGAVKVALAAPGRGFGTARVETLIAGDSVGGLTGAVAGDRTMVLAWEAGPGDFRQPGTIQVAVRRPGGRFGPIQAIDGPGQLHGLALVGGRSGGVLASWYSSADPAGPRIALLPAGGSAFGPVETAPAAATAAGLLPDGTALLSDGISVWRRPPSGGYVAPEAVPSGLGGAGRIAVASDGGAAMAGDDGHRVWVSLAAPGSVFVSPVAVGPDPGEVTGSGLDVDAWPGGRVAIVVRGGGDVGPAFTDLYAVDPGSGTPVVAEVVGDRLTVDVAGSQAGSLALFTVAGGRLYELDRPGTADHRRPLIDARVDQECITGRKPFCAVFVDSATHTAVVSASVDKAAVISARAKVRSATGVTRRVPVTLAGGVRRLQRPPFAAFDVRVPVPAGVGACRGGGAMSYAVTVSVRDRAGDVSRRTVRFSVRCAVSRRPAPRPSAAA